MTRMLAVYVLALLAVSFVFMQYAMPWYWMMLSLVEVSVFFGFAYDLTWEWQEKNERYVEKHLFWLTVVWRLIWIIVFYGITNSLWNTPWEQPIGVDIDSAGYFHTSQWIEECVRENKLDHYISYVKMVGWSDVGYPMLLALFNFLSDDSILFTRIPNALFDAWTVVLIYRLGKRNFGDSVAKMAAVFTMLMPTMFYFVATTMKESTMVMLCIWFVERADYTIRQPRLSIKNVVYVSLLVLEIAFFRTVLAWVAVLSFACALLLTSSKLINYSRKLTIGITGGVICLMLFGGVFLQQLEEMQLRRQQTNTNLQFRATREGGNKLAARLNKAVFFPLVATIPFPTMVNITYQQAQQIQNGGYYIKNVLSFFCILAMVLLLVSKEWKQSVVCIAFYLGYLVVLALSSYAQSGRFHQPIIPLVMLFAAYGIVHFKSAWKKYFNWLLAFEFVVIMAWNWFKLRGRGM